MTRSPSQSRSRSPSLPAAEVALDPPESQEPPPLLPAGAANAMAAPTFEADALKVVVFNAGLRACTSRDAELEPAGMGSGPHAYCWECGSVSQKLLTCGRCKVARYCSKVCQKAAWKAEWTGVGHKETCRNFLENLRPPGIEDQGKCAAISAAGSAWLDEEELQTCLEQRERFFLADPHVPDVLHLTISCTNALDAVRLGISASFHHIRPRIAMDLYTPSSTKGCRQRRCSIAPRAAL